MTIDHPPSPVRDRLRARRAGVALARLLAAPSCTGGAVLHVDDSPTITLRLASLDAARSLARRLGLDWHTQATGAGPGALHVHTFEGLHCGIPLTVYALGDADPDATTVEGTAAAALILGGLIL
jgi:hypothetical protein